MPALPMPGPTQPFIGAGGSSFNPATGPMPPHAGTMPNMGMPPMSGVGIPSYPNTTPNLPFQAQPSASNYPIAPYQSAKPRRDYSLRPNQPALSGPGMSPYDPARYQAKLRSIDNFMQGMAPQLSGYDVETFKNAMMMDVPAYMNPVIVNLPANLGEMMSENKSYGVNSRYMSPSEARGRLDMFLKNREKMAIRIPWNHPMKDTVTREYRELLKVANGG
jgi:hypothetical protein